MTNFEQIREQAKKVFFNRKNWYKADFMFDIYDGVLIPMGYVDSSHGSFISLTEYSEVFDDYRITGLMDLLEEEGRHNKKHQKEFLIGAEKVFDEWFDDFYTKIKNYAMEHRVRMNHIGAYISYDHIAYLEKHKDEEDSPLF